jgi:hypothetical protein
MLELRPSCEQCDRALPPDTTEACICSFECTFCRACVELLENVCPNCGGGFCPRPNRPRENWRGDNYLGKYPARVAPRHKPVNLQEHAGFAARLRELPVHAR